MTLEEPFMKIQILLVDDEKDFLEPLTQRLQIRNFHVETALSGESALDRIQRNDLDVVVLDVLMPGKDGIETLREIKKRRPLLQVILLTGHATVEAAIEGMKLGAYDFLVKPADVKNLAEKVIQAHAIKKEHQERIRKAEINRIVQRKGW
jgi:DNA-binding NtrC family response regulator